MSITASSASIFCSRGGSYVWQSLSLNSWYGSSPLGRFRKVDSFLKVVELNFESTYQYFVHESVTFLRLKFASARMDHASGSALSNIGSKTEAPKTAAALRGTDGPACPGILLVAMTSLARWKLRWSLRKPNGQGCRPKRIRWGWGVDARPGLSSAWLGAKFFKEKTVRKTYGELTNEFVEGWRQGLAWCRRPRRPTSRVFRRSPLLRPDLNRLLFPIPWLSQPRLQRDRIKEWIKSEN